MLEGVNVALGVSGSIAAVKTVELSHELRRQGASVRAVTTDASTSIVHPWALEFATGRDVVTELTGSVEHVALCGEDGWADVLLLAPATANTIGKIAAAIDDTPVTTCATTALGADTPVVVAPAMHEPMYDHPGVLEAIERVESWGVRFVGPRIAEGKAKIADEGAIVEAVARAVGDDSLAGTHVVVTAGATLEAIDPVRALTNRASGQTGRAIASACFARGADVTLVHGVVGPQEWSSTPPAERTRWGVGSGHPEVTLHPVETVEEMLTATLDACKEADVLVSTAAVGDFTTAVHPEKIRSGQELTLTFEPTPKIIDAIAETHPEVSIVPFKAETATNESDVVDAARKTIDRLDEPFAVANDAAVMGEASTTALLVEADEIQRVEGSKIDLAERVVEKIAETAATRE